MASARVSCTTACPISRMRALYAARISARELVSPGRSPPEIFMSTILFIACVLQELHNRLTGRCWRDNACCGTQPQPWVRSLSVRRKVCQQRRSQVAAAQQRCEQNCGECGTTQKEWHAQVG